MSQRIKGQETTMGFTDPDGDVENLGAVKSFEATLEIETLEEGYLGETANRFDDIFNGVSGQVELHLESATYFAFAQKVQDRAERRTPAGGMFSATSTLAFPNGQRVRLTFEDIFFGELPLRVPERGQYVSVTLQWKCSSIRRAF